MNYLTSFPPEMKSYQMREYLEELALQYPEISKALNDNALNNESENDLIALRKIEMQEIYQGYKS